MPVYDHAIVLRLHPWSNNLISQSSLIEKFLSSSYNSTEVSIETAGWSTCFVYLEVEKFWRKWPKATRFVVEMTWFDGGKGSGVVRKFQPRKREDAFRDKLLDCPIRLALRDGSFSGTVKIVVQPQIEGRQSVRNLEAYTAIFHYVPSPVAYSSPLQRDRQLFLKGGWIPFFREIPWLDQTKNANAKPRSAISQPVVETASSTTASEVPASASTSCVQLAQSIEAMRNEIEELKRQQLEEELEALDAELKTLRERKRTKSSTDGDATVMVVSEASKQGSSRVSPEHRAGSIASTSSVTASSRLAAVLSVRDYAGQGVEDSLLPVSSLSSPVRAGSSSTAHTHSSMQASSPRRKPKLSQRFLDRVRNHCMEDRELKTNQRRSATTQGQNSQAAWLPPSDKIERRHPPEPEHPSCSEQQLNEANQQDEKAKTPLAEPDSEKAVDEYVAFGNTGFELLSAAEGRATPVAPSRPSIAMRTAVKRPAMDPFVGSEERDTTPEAIKRCRVDVDPSVRPKTMTPPEGDIASPLLVCPQSAGALESGYSLIDDDDDDDGYAPSTPV